jgi:predicted ATPase/DNA-binding CsgD family transcriptional regulator
MAEYQLTEALTEREIEILAAMAKGQSNPEIAASLHLALTTVKWYNTQIFGKLGVASRKEAVQQAQRLNLLQEKKAEPSSPTNLPPQNTPFVGRKEELSEVAALLQESRLLTIQAAGGMGKTRLGLEFSQSQRNTFEDGVYWVQLAPLNFPEMLLPALADVFQLYDYNETGDIKRTILNFFRNKEMLFFFDNFEHLISSAGIVSDLLQAAPRLKILVTSRERLNLQGETVFTLSGMPFPKNESQNIGGFDAVKLFVQAARRVRPDYELNDYDLPYIVEVCNLVEGMPLGLELAAGWMDVLNVDKIAEEIRRCTTFLETELRDVPERHRSIRATFQRSWESLTESEQATMMWLSVFRGGFRQEAAEAVALADIRRLKRLVNKSLLSYNSFGRYEMHELLRQFSEEKLHEAGDFEAAQIKHASYFAEYADELQEDIDAMQGAASQAFAADFDNIAAAWKTILRVPRFDLLNTIKGGVWLYMSTQGRTFEAVDWFVNALNVLRPSIADDEKLRFLYGKMLVHLSNIQVTLVSLDEHRRTIDEALSILEPFGATYPLVWAYQSLADYYYKLYQDTSKEAAQAMFKASQYAEAMNDIESRAHIAQLLGGAYIAQGDFASARKHLEQALELVKTESETEGYINFNIYMSLADLFFHEGLYEDAEPYLDKALFLAERATWVYGISGARNMKAFIAVQRGNLQEARQHIASILHWHQTHARDWQTVGALYGCFAEHLLILIGEYEYAAEVWAFVHHHPLAFTAARIRSLQLLESTREYIDEASYQAAIERGKSKSLSQMLKEAMAYLGNQHSAKGRKHP